MNKVLERVVKFLGSYGLACILLLLLLLLTFLGTWEQRHRSLYDVQKEYFESAFLVYDVGGVIPVPLPGVYLLLLLLFVNLVVGGIIRLRKKATTVGVLIIHIGILLLLIGGFVEERWSTKGHMTLYEGQSSDEFESYYDWEVVITEYLPNGGVRERVIPHEVFSGIEAGESVRAFATELPVDVVLIGYLCNGQPRPAMRPGEGTEGFLLQALDPAKNAEANTAALYVTLVEKETRVEHRSILWGMQRFPYQVHIADRRWEVDLRRQRWDVPFTIALDDFVHEVHPGTGMAKRFSSYVRKIEDGVVQDIHITMNEPLRHRGYTFFQSGWGPQNAAPGTPLFSTFAVVQNPSDRFPLISCIIIGLGLLIHWIWKLVLFLLAESRRRAAEGSRA
ncbi:MAG: cytochrome c biogenesis protein ResB [Planctomycetota bacterium]